MSDLIFPLGNKISWDTKISQTWDVAEQKSASGRRRTLCQQTLPGWTIEVSYPNLTKAERDTLLGFYAQCKGKFNSFYYRDDEICVANNVTLTKGTDGKYQCLITHGGFGESAEKVSDLVVKVNGTATTNYTESKGKITISTSGTVTASYKWYWKVCFASGLSISQKFADYYAANLKLEVVRE